MLAPRQIVTEGYRRDGDVLGSDSSFVKGSYRVIADAGEGVIVLGFRPAAVAQAIEDAPGTDNPARPLIEEVEGVTRGVAVQDSPSASPGSRSASPRTSRPTRS